MKKLLCKIFFHKLYVYAKPKEDWSEGVRWLKCKRCKKDFVINDGVEAFAFLPMDFEIKDMHEWEVNQAHSEA